MRRNIMLKTILIMVTVVLLLCSNYATAADSTKVSIETLKKSIINLESRIDGLSKETDDIGFELARFVSDLEELRSIVEMDKSFASPAYEKMNMDMSDLSAELDKLGKRLDEITQKFKLQSTVQDENIKKLAELKDAQARTEAAQRQSVIISISSIAVAVVALMVSIFL